MREYVRLHWLDALLCFAAGFALAAMVFAGFDSPDPLTVNYPAIALVAAAVTALMFVFGYSRAATVAGIVTGIAALVAAALALRAAGLFTEGGNLDENPALFWLVAVAAPVLVYLLARSRVGTLLLFLAGALTAAAYGYLEYPLSLPCYLLFLLCAALLALYRVYHGALLRSAAGRGKTGGYLLQSLIFAAALLAVSGLIYDRVIRPLDPPVEELALATRTESLEILEVLGVSRKTEIQTDDLSTVNENDLTQTTREEPPEPEETPPPEPTEPERPEPDRNETAPAEAIRYDAPGSGLLILILALAAVVIALPFVLRHVRRRRWEERLRRGDPTDGSLALYDYMEKRLRYAGFVRPEGVTLEEYVTANAPALADFAVGDSGFPLLAEHYQRAVYGCRALDAAETEPFWTVYGAFRKNLRRKLGFFRYALRFFTI